jgi:hypothetical protein
MESKHLWIGAGVALVGYFAYKSMSSASADDAPAPAPKNCPPVSLPAPAGSTDFDGMPAGFREAYEAPMRIMAGDVSKLTQESAAVGAETLALHADCAGYVIAAQRLRNKAKEIRSWAPAGNF